MDKGKKESDSPDEMTAAAGTKEGNNPPATSAEANPTESASAVTSKLPKSSHWPTKETVAEMFLSSTMEWSSKRTSDALHDSSVGERSPKKSPVCKSCRTVEFTDKSPNGRAECEARPKASPFKAAKETEGSPSKKDAGSDGDSPKRRLDRGVGPKIGPLKVAAMKALDFEGIPVDKSPPRRPSTLELDPELFVPSRRFSGFGIELGTGLTLGGVLLTPPSESPTREIGASVDFSLRREAESLGQGSSCGAAGSSSANAAADDLREVKSDSFEDSESASSCPDSDPPIQKE